MNSYGEFETDKVIRSYFPDLSYKGTFIEVGAARPDFLSLSRHFKETGWSTIGVDANPVFAEMHRQAGNRIINVALSNYIADDVDFQIMFSKDNAGYEGGVVTMESFSSLKPWSHVGSQMTNGLYKAKKIIKVNVRTLDYLYDHDLADIKKVDVISIDVEGGELDVLKGLTNKNLYPTLFVIECLYNNRNAEEAAILGSMGYIKDKAQSHNHFYRKMN